MAEKKSARRKPSKSAKPKSKQSSAEEAANDPERSSAASGTIQPKVEADRYEGKLYTTGSWKGLPNYECMFCGFATVNHHTALEHAAEAHSPPEPEIVNTGVVDENGNPITRAR